MTWRILLYGTHTRKWHELHRGEDEDQAHRLFKSMNVLFRKKYGWAAPAEMLLTDDPAGQRTVRHEVYP